MSPNHLAGKGGREEFRVSDFASGKSLTRNQKAAWNKWAKLNRVMQPNGLLDYVSGHKACTIIMANRSLMGWTHPITQTPEGDTSLLPTPFLTNVDCGAYTAGPGQLVLRTLVPLNPLARDSP